MPYAAIHNEGGTINTHPRVTPAMRSFAWAMYYKNGGNKGKTAPPLAAKWRALALTKKDTLDVHAVIPRRQFMGPSRELIQTMRQKINDCLASIGNKLGLAKN